MQSARQKQNTKKGKKEKKNWKWASASIQMAHTQIIPGIVRMTQLLAETQDMSCTEPLKLNEPRSEACKEEGKA